MTNRIPPPASEPAASPMAAKLERRLEVVTLGPADRLVVVFPADLSQDEAANAHEIIKARGWGDRVLMLAGVEQLAVLRGDPKPARHVPARPGYLTDAQLAAAGYPPGSLDYEHEAPDDRV